MALDVRRGDLTVGVAGCGIMGRGIAQVAAAAGCRVILLDDREGVAAQSRSLAADTFAKLAARGKMPEGKAREAAANPTIFYDNGQPRTIRQVYKALVAQHEGPAALDPGYAVQQMMAGQQQPTVSPNQVVVTYPVPLAPILGTGGNKYPLEALKTAGIDMTKPEAMDRAFKVLEGFVDRLEKLI